jgi:pyruvate formate lyase activating enzyme
VNVLGHHHHAEGDRWRCDVCPRACLLSPGQRGFCYVREGSDRGVELTTYGRSSGFCIDPIEKKPLAHFHPGTSVLSFGTAGCNLGCKFCQNWDISKSRQDDTLQSSASPDTLAAAAVEAGCASAAFTYNDPTIFLEYAVDCAKACRARGVHPVAVTNGYIHGDARIELYENMDAANIDLKAFTEKFYRDVCLAHIEPVKETLVHVAKNTSCWLEITTLLIPGHNDSDAEIRELAEWIATNVGTDVPLHFTAFHPDYKLVDAPPTPPATLRRARTIAREVGLKHVYTGNIRDVDGQSTRCTSCNATVIGRDGYDILSWSLDARGACMKCGTKLNARIDGAPGTWGSRRQRLHIVA